MLHREYFPWLPNNDSIPRAPVDPPLLEAEAPPRWWEDSAAELFGAAENISLLLNEASECGVHLMTPFAGFCAFSASFCNIYVTQFPKMNLGRSLRSRELEDVCNAYLQDFRQVWSIADSWVSTTLNPTNFRKLTLVADQDAQTHQSALPASSSKRHPLSWPHAIRLRCLAPLCSRIPRRRQV